MKLPTDNREAMQAGYEGSWANGWGDEVPEKVKNCTCEWDKTGNGKRSIELNYRGTLKIYFCDVCKYYYTVDSGD